MGERDRPEQVLVKKRRRGCAAAVGLLGTIAVVLCGAVVLLGPFGRAVSQGSIRNGLLPEPARFGRGRAGPTRLASIQGYQKNRYKQNGEVIDKVKRHWGFVFDQWGYTQVC